MDIKNYIEPTYSADPDWYQLAKDEISTGTTIMAVEYDGGVVIGADSRTTRGSYIANRVTDKLTHITDRIYCCRSGSAADTQAIANEVQYQLDLYSLEIGKRPLVKTAAMFFRNLCYERRDEASAGILCAGWDEREGGQLYSVAISWPLMSHFAQHLANEKKVERTIGVYSIPLGGMIVRQPFSIGGSGSTYIYGHCDSTYRTGMDREQCIRFVQNAIALAIFRDGSSGGCIRLAVINEDGVERRLIQGDQLPQYFHD